MIHEVEGVLGMQTLDEKLVTQFSMREHVQWRVHMLGPYDNVFTHVMSTRVTILPLIQKLLYST